MPTATKKIEAWFEWPGDPDKSRVLFVLLDDVDLAEIRQKSEESRRYYDPDSNALSFETRTNQAEERKATAKRATKGWENFYSAERAQMPCTPENIERWAMNHGFMLFLNECQEKLAEIEAKEREEARKNS